MIVFTQRSFAFYGNNGRRGSETQQTAMIFHNLFIFREISLEKKSELSQQESDKNSMKEN